MRYGLSPCCYVSFILSGTHKQLAISLNYALNNSHIWMLNATCLLFQGVMIKLLTKLLYQFADVS